MRSVPNTGGGCSDARRRSPNSRARQARFPNRHLGAIGMKALIAFDLDGTLADSKQPLDERMGQALADLLAVAEVAIISGGDWPQFDKQVARDRKSTRLNSSH